LPKAQGSHPTEDWRHAVRAVEQGYRVAHAGRARVSTPLRSSLAEATQQGARWERGRLLNAGTYALRLLWIGLYQRNRLKIFAALDAMQPPVAILAALSIAVAVLTYLFSSHDTFSLKLIGYLPMMLIALYGTIVVIRGRREGISLSTVVWAPIYVIWRCLSFLLAWAFLDRINLGKRRAAAHGVDGCAQPELARSKSGSDKILVDAISTKKLAEKTPAVTAVAGSEKNL
jgi:hypothetical protein